MSTDIRRPLRAALQLGLVSLLAVGAVSLVERLTRAPVAAAKTQAARDALQIVLPAARFDNDPLADAVQVRAPAWLGQDSATVHRATLQGLASALVLEATAPDGYGGPIHLQLAVAQDGRVLGVRVTAHSETPGLGDKLDAGRSDWITRFQGRALGDPPPARWTLRRDGGDFDQFAGATVTPRAVVLAVKRSLDFAARHGAELHAAAAGATLRFDTAPEPTP